MSVLDGLKEDIKNALKSGDREKAEILRFLNAQIQNRLIEKRGQDGSESLGDEEVLDVFRKEVKRHKDAIELFNKGGRSDLAEKEQKELEIIQDYLPAAPTEEEIRSVIQALRQEGLSGFPVLMKEAMQRLRGADGALVSRLVKDSEK